MTLILCGALDYNTLARFRTDRLGNCLDDLFNQFITKLGEMNEIALTFEINIGKLERKITVDRVRKIY